MRRLLIVVLALCGAAWGGTISSVFDQFPQVVQGNGGSSTCVFNNNVVSGNTVLIGGHSEGALTTPTDTRTTTWTLVDSNTATGGRAYVWIGVLGSSGAETITLTGSLVAPRTICIELPPSIGSTVDVHTNGSFPNVTSPFTTSAITTTANGDFLFFYVGNDCSNCAESAQLPLFPMQTNGGDSNAAGFAFATTNGSYTATFTASNASGGSGNSGYVAMALKPAAIIIDTATLPSASLTNSYSYCLQARGGAGAYTWSISSGALPTGLSISSSTGCITGTPTAGTTTPTFQVTDGTHTTTSALAMTVNSSATAPSLIQSINTNTSTASFTSVSSGDCIVVSTTTIANPTALAIPTDGLGTVFRLITGSIVRDTGNLAYQSLFAGKATSSGSDTVTLINGFIATQWHNCQVFGDAISVANGTNVGVATLTSSALVTPAPNSAIWAAWAAASTTATSNAGSGYTADVTGSVAALPEQGEHQAVSAAGSTAVTFAQTANASGSWVITGIALRPLTSGVVSTNHRRAWVIQQP